VVASSQEGSSRRGRNLIGLPKPWGGGQRRGKSLLETTLEMVGNLMTRPPMSRSGRRGSAWRGPISEDGTRKKAMEMSNSRVLALQTNAMIATEGNLISIQKKKQAISLATARFDSSMSGRRGLRQPHSFRTTCRGPCTQGIESSIGCAEPPRKGRGGGRGMRGNIKKTPQVRVGGDSVNRITASWRRADESVRGGYFQKSSGIYKAGPPDQKGR